MTTTIVSETGRDAALAHESLFPIELFSARAIRNFSVAAGAVQAGNIAAPGAFTDRDAPGPLAGLAPSRFSFEGIDPTGLYAEIEATAGVGITTVLYSLLIYLSEDGVTWHFSSALAVADTTALVSGNPADTGLQVAGGTTFRSFGPLFGSIIIPGSAPAEGKFAAIAIRNNSIGALNNAIVVSCRIVERPT